MNSEEKFQQVLNLVPPRDRTEIPVYPMMVTFPARFAGYTQAQALESADVFLESLDKVYDELGPFDVVQAMVPDDALFGEGLDARKPGQQLGEDDLYQFIEADHLGDGGYDDIIEHGWTQFFMRYMMSIQHPPYTDPAQIGARFGLMGQRAGQCMMHVLQRGMAPIYGTAAMPIFDMLSMIRSMVPFCMDMYDDPEKIKAAVEKGTPEIIGQTLETMKQIPIKRIGVFPMRSDANSISPSQFDEFSWPTLKQVISTFWDAGYVSIIHADGNWLPMLDRFLELPKGSCLFELDGFTDIKKAYEIIGGHHSIRGDVKGTMLAFGTADEVTAYCDDLIETIGMKGGFMLASGCEVPLNTKPENLAAMFNAVKPASEKKDLGKIAADWAARKPKNA